jgi:hypothetical protein
MAVEHLTAEQLDGYRQGTLSPRRRAAVVRHITACALCHAAARDSQTLRRAMVGLFPGIVPHPAYENLAALLDRAVDGATRSRLDAHLDACAPCRNRRDALARLREQAERLGRLPAGDAAAGPSRAVIPLGRVVAAAALVAIVALIGGTAAGFYVRSLQARLEAAERRERSRSRDLQALLQETALVAELRSQVEQLERDEAALRRERDGLQQQIRELTVRMQSPSSSPDRIRDGEGEIALDAPGGPARVLRSEAPLPEEVVAALADPRLPIPADVRKLLEPLSGVRADPARPLPLAPIGCAVRSQRPEFRWKAVPGADAYRVSVYDRQGQLLARSEAVRGTTWTPGRDLPRARELRWDVAAGSAEPPETPDSPWRFIVLGRNRLRTLDADVARYGVSRLIPAVLYLRAGLLDEAETELAAVEQANPGSAPVRALVEYARGLRKELPRE